MASSIVSYDKGWPINGLSVDERFVHNEGTHGTQLFPDRCIGQDGAGECVGRSDSDISV